MHKPILSLLAVLALLAGPALAQRETVFRTGFEYGNDEPDGVFEPSELNGAEDQIGEWSGDEFPEGQGDLPDLGCDLGPPCDSVGFRDNPWDSSRLLIMDRPMGDPDRPNSQPNSDFEGSILADLTMPVLLIGAEVQFDLGVFRTGGNNNKDFSIVGRGSDGEENFHLRIGTNNNGGERLGIRTDNGANTIFDLPTVVGEDRGTDLNNMGANPAGGVFQVGDEFPTINLKLGPDGYVIELAHIGNPSGESNSYVSDVLPYNGPAEDLAQIDFGYKASSANGRNGGFALDNILVSGFDEYLQGDFDLNGALDMNDFMILANNFATQTPEGDFDLNGTVDLHDFVGFKAAFNAANAPAGAAAVPEPATSSLISIGLLGLLARRRRRI